MQRVHPWLYVAALSIVFAPQRAFARHHHPHVDSGGNTTTADGTVIPGAGNGHSVTATDGPHHRSHHRHPGPVGGGGGGGEGGGTLITGGGHGHGDPGTLDHELQHYKDNQVKAAKDKFNGAVHDAKELSNPHSQAYKDALGKWEASDPKGQDYVNKLKDAQQQITNCENLLGYSAKHCKRVLVEDPHSQYEKDLHQAHADLHSFNQQQEKATHDGILAAQNTYHQQIKAINSQDLTGAQLAVELQKNRDKQFAGAKSTEDKAIAAAKALSDPHSQAYKDALKNWVANDPKGQDYAQQIAKAQADVKSCQDLFGYAASQCRQLLANDPDSQYAKAMKQAEKDLGSFTAQQEALTDQGIATAKSAFTQAVAAINKNDPSLAQITGSEQNNLTAQLNAAKATENKAIDQAKSLSDPDSQAYKDALANWKKNDPKGRDYAQQIKNAEDDINKCVAFLGYPPPACKNLLAKDKNSVYYKALQQAGQDLAAFNAQQKALTDQGIAAATTAFNNAVAQINASKETGNMTALKTACGELSGAQQTNCDTLEQNVNAADGGAQTTGTSGPQNLIVQENLNAGE